MDLKDIKETNIWQLYEKGRNYHRMTGIYVDTNRNYRMFNGDQWAGAKLGDVEPIQLNFIQPIIKYKIAVIHDNLYSIVYSSENYENKVFRKEAERICDMLNGYASKAWEKGKMDRKCREITADAIINDEGIIYVDFDKTNMLPVNEVIKKNDIYYGNENDDDIQAQPYILIRKRMPVANAIEYAIKNGVSKEKAKLIVGDNDTFDQSGDAARLELDNNVTLVYKMYKLDGTVHYSVSSRLVDIIKDADLGISLYPVAHYNFEKREGSARGVGETRQLIPNQIELNRTLVRRALTVKEQAFPTTVIDAHKIANPEAIHTVGAVIETNGQAVEDVHKIVGIIPPAQMSSDVIKLQEDLINISRDLAGAGETATGTVNPESASGRAILAVQRASRAPLNTQVEGFKDFIEDVANIWLAYVIEHSTDGITLEESYTDPTMGEDAIRLVKVPQSALKALKASVKIDITPKSVYDRFAQEQTIENLLMAGYFNHEKSGELEIYYKVLPDDSVAPKVMIGNAIDYIKEQKRKIAMIQQKADLLKQKYQTFLMEDPEAQAQQIADAQAIVNTRKAMQGLVEEEAMIDTEEAVKAEEMAMDESDPATI